MGVDDEDKQPTQKLTSTNEVTHYCILLPKLSMYDLPHKKEEPIYTLIDLEWNNIQPDGLIGLPKFPGAMYNL